MGSNKDCKQYYAQVQKGSSMWSGDVKISMLELRLEHYAGVAKRFLMGAVRSEGDQWYCAFWA